MILMVYSLIMIYAILTHAIFASPEITDTCVVDALGVTCHVISPPIAFVFTIILVNINVFFVEFPVIIKLVSAVKLVNVVPNDSLNDIVIDDALDAGVNVAVHTNDIKQTPNGNTVPVPKMFVKDDDVNVIVVGFETELVNPN